MEPHDHTQYTTNDSPREQHIISISTMVDIAGRINRALRLRRFSPEDPQRNPKKISEPDHPAASDDSRLAALVTKLSWLLASSAADHMTSDVNQMTDYTLAPDDLVTNVPNKGAMRVHGSGSVRTATMSLHNVMHVPGLDKNLVSTSQLAKAGYTVTLGPSGCRITKDQMVVGEAHFTEDYLFEVDFLRVPSSTA